jgi:tetratricopeptide (TPR) repeat protein
MTERSGLDPDRQMIEAIHHATAAGDYDAAAAMLYQHVYGGPSARFTRVLGRYELILDTLTGFYPLGDLSLDPRLTDPAARRWILHETAVCAYVLCRLPLAAELGARAAAAAIAAGDRHNAALSYHNLAEVHLAAGALASCRAVTIEASQLAIEAGEMEDQLVAHTLFGTLDDFACGYDEASRHFDRAIEIAIEHTSNPLLYSLSGIRYADHLAEVGRSEDAVDVIRSNLMFCREQGWQSDVALCLAQLASTGPEPLPELLDRADEAVRTARTIGAKHVLAETLLGRAQLAARAGRLETAYTDLTEVLGSALSAGFRLLEVDARTALAATRQAMNEPLAARTEAQLAEQMGRELEYERGARRAAEVLADLQS